MSDDSRVVPGPYEARGANGEGNPFVHGPGNGTGYNSGTLFPDMVLSSLKDAQAAARIANTAYEQGRLSMQREFCKLLGLP